MMPPEDARPRRPPSRRPLWWLLAPLGVMALLLLAALLLRQRPAASVVLVTTPTTAGGLVIPTAETPSLPLPALVTPGASGPSPTVAAAPIATVTPPDGLATVGPADPGPAPAGVGEVVAERVAAETPLIDGNLAEWLARPGVSSDFLVFGEEDWDGSQDVNGIWRLAWDQTFLYVSVAVSDDTHVQTQGGNQTYRGDSVELQLDTDRQGDFGPGLSPDDFQIALSPGDLGSLPPSAFRFTANAEGRIRDAPGHGVVVAARPVADGYWLEAAIPWADINVTPIAGMVLGLALNVNDNDRPGAAVQEVMMSTAPGRTLTDPTTWGTLVLGIP